jgi:hypothetical protein
VTEYWIVDVGGGAIEVRRTPGATGYATTTRHVRSESLVVPGFEDVTVHVGDVLPRA